MGVAREPSASASAAPEIEFGPSAVYSEDKDAVIVVAEFGNLSDGKVTIRDAKLSIDGIADLWPSEPGWAGGLEVQGYEWIGLRPFPVDAMSLVKIAWFPAATWTVACSRAVILPWTCHRSLGSW